MVGTRNNRKGYYAADLAVYVRNIAEDNSAQHSQLKRNLAKAMQEELTCRQYQCLVMYYVDELNMATIAEQLGIDKTTVSRTIKRGEGKLRRCLKYGARELLNQVMGE